MFLIPNWCFSLVSDKVKYGLVFPEQSRCSSRVYFNTTANRPLSHSLLK